MYIIKDSLKKTKKVCVKIIIKIIDRKTGNRNAKKIKLPPTPFPLQKKIMHGKWIQLFCFSCWKISERRNVLENIQYEKCPYKS